MTTENGKSTGDRNENSEERPVNQGIDRFAKYTAPAMLAMLISAGQGSPAYAASFNP